ncbi:ABC transporter, ATP-binding protein [Oceanicola granulosus HTCC2516]|uniref:ABC transporter, ATP-binding protein n=1 Tax=Oceanicola granulosus (strain ATCC BAA-861 / DSM 15982 / KCTC 12143 / HTCC2516) TaxID=314256 RepID=Q2CCI1_OCEGH|nr:ABC transporter ATP-binding protein [Oceanicola granulosus]EAR50337.1 ABC transporter, ATP-binding protein [Oceanicola granulosus HTCC2516]
MAPIVKVEDLTKRYESGFTALEGVDLEIEEGEIIALLGPNGAGKTTLISTICGITMPTSGSVSVGGYDTVRDFRKARQMIGLVPQEISLEPFEKVVATVNFSRGLFGMSPNRGFVDDLLRKLSLIDKRDTKVKELSGGMRRRVLIAKALAHEPRVLFLDEPTAGVDVELRKDMWDIVAELKAQGVTIILTTHYIEEAEAIADRIAVIDKGRILLVENKADLMTRLGAKELRIELAEPVDAIPDSLAREGLELAPDGRALIYIYDTRSERTGITRLLADLQAAGLQLADLQTKQSSLEEIFVGLVHQADAAPAKEPAA